MCWYSYFEPYYENVFVHRNELIQNCDVARRNLLNYKVYVYMTKLSVLMQLDWTRFRHPWVFVRHHFLFCWDFVLSPATYWLHGFCPISRATYIILLRFCLIARATYCLLRFCPIPKHLLPVQILSYFQSYVLSAEMLSCPQPHKIIACLDFVLSPEPLIVCWEPLIYSVCYDFVPFPEQKIFHLLFCPTSNVDVFLKLCPAQ